ncbi:hypothetical protein CMO96_05045 [Candidatus Woesebacteria bacterium]|nr:hypothetical protein [Candidatus Woesebacteria bacterium]
MKNPEEKKVGVEIRNTPTFKLKDKERRQYQPIHLVKQFGFVPETIVIRKVQGKNNTFFISAILTEKAKKARKQLPQIVSKANQKK